MALRQENDEIRAIYGAGNYTLSTAYSKFNVDSSRWHSWGEDRRRDHVEKFRHYQPTPSDFFRKPKNVGRKPGAENRIRNENPTVIVDRIEEQRESSNDNTRLHPEEPSSTDSSISQTNDGEGTALRFADPRLEPEKQFELYFRKDLPRLIKKCQGMCGKPIRPDDDDMIVKSYGTSTWTDRNTGLERSKFGPMYIHFNQKCLETFDSENSYGPGNRFDYNRVEVHNSTQTKLQEAERMFLIQLGVKFL